MALRIRCLLASLLSLALLAPPALATGDLDPTFAAGAGYTLVPLGGDAADRGWFSAVHIDQAGRIVAAGHAEGTGSSDDFDFSIARLLDDGSLDPSFGSGGVVTVDLAGDLDLASATFATADGRTVACGSATTPLTGKSGTLAAVRLTAGGALDTSFDLDGRVVLHLEHPDEGTINPIAVGGCTPAPGGGLVMYGGLFQAGLTSASALLVRLNANGSLDTSFGDGGMLVFDVAGGAPLLSAVSNAIVQADGSIVASGFTNVADDGVQYDLFATRVLPGGSVDPTFGEDGLTVVAFDQGGGDVDVASGLAITPGGGIVIAATVYTAASGYDIGLVRLLPDGSLDPSFGTGGRALVGYNAGGALNDEARDLAVDGDGRLYVAGVVDVASANTDAMVARLDSSGALDTGFADGGWMVLGVDAPLTSPLEFASALALDHDGRVVAVGSASPQEAAVDGLVLRLTSDQVFADGFEALP